MSRKYDARKILDKQKSSHRAWLLDPASIEMKLRAEGYLKQYLPGDSPAALLMVSDRLVRLATWYGTSGQIATIDQNNAGLQEIHRSWLYLSLAMRMRISVFQKGRVLGQFRPVKGLETEASPSALCLAYAIMVRRDFETDFFGGAVRTMLIDKEIVREEYWQYHPVEPFMIQLLALFRSERLDVPREFGRSLGVYQKVFDAWNEPSALAGAIGEACNFHCERIEDKSNAFFSEFRSPPFDLIPAEILAIYTVRKALGLETPSVDHPLLQPPFSIPLENNSEVKDELLDRLEAEL